MSVMTDEVNTGRRRFLTAATSVVGAAGVVAVAVPFVGSWNPSAKAKAAGAPVKVDISKVEPGQMIVAEWRGKPVYVLHRTDEELANLDKQTDLLADPDSERKQQPAYVVGSARSIKPNFLVAIGLCTHLGCAPKFRPEVEADWLGGFFLSLSWFEVRFGWSGLQRCSCSL
jgi:ubiquinol-cytochrome c reductase iron-sulfur subunit